MAFRFGDPNLFVMGTVDQTLYDPYSGDVLGYDKLANDVATNYTADFTEITGFRNSLVMSIPQNTRLTGTYTSAAFSLNSRALLTGSQISYNAVSRVCEEITADGTSLTVSRTPAKFYAQPASDTKGWAYVHEKGAAQYEGVRYYVDLATGEVEGFTATSGTVYEVVYFTEIASAQVLGLRNSANPSVVSILQKWGVYAAQNGSRANGTLQGYLHVVVPLAMLEGDAGIDGNQTSNSTSSYNWRAFSPSDNLPVCDNCNDDSDYLAYYVFVPCGDAAQDVEGLAVIGGGVSVGVGQTAQIPVKYIMPDNSLVQPVFADMTYVSSASGTASVSTGGVVTGATAGNADITITLAREGKPSLTAICNVTVTA